MIILYHIIKFSTCGIVLFMNEMELKMSYFFPPAAASFIDHTSLSYSLYLHVL